MPKAWQSMCAESWSGGPDVMADPIWGARDRELKIRNWELQKFVKRIAILIGLWSLRGDLPLTSWTGQCLCEKSDAEVYRI